MVVSLFKSKLFRTSGATVHEFESVFDRSPKLILPSAPTETDILIFVQTCHYFDLDFIPFSDLFPHTSLCYNVYKEMEPTHPCYEWFDLMMKAFLGDMSSVLKCEETRIWEWVHRHRFSFNFFVYEYFLFDLNPIPESQRISYFQYFQTVLDISPSSRSMELALEQGQKETATWLLRHPSCLVSYNLSVAIRHYFPLEFLKEMVKQGCPTESLSVATACSLGRLDVVQWWKEQNFPFCESASAWASMNGHLAMIQYLHQHNKILNLRWTLSNAYKYGHVHIINFLDP